MDKKNDFTLDVMMFGGRRAGKTSILAAMRRCFDEIYGKSELTISSADNSTLAALEEKNNEINEFFANRNKFGGTFQPDSNPTEEMNTYSFRISMKSKPSNNLLVNFTDYPGEWLEKRNSNKWADIENHISSSQIIIVAIDTPFLMECCNSNNPTDIGKYNKKNFCDRIGEWVKQADQNLCDGKKRPRMIMFVPLKCEKYKHNMNEVYTKVKTAYKSLINYVTAPTLCDSAICEVVIAPILTFGTAKFARFGADENGEIKEINGLPEDIFYTFEDNAGNTPEPKGCEIPLELVLIFLLYHVKEARKANKPEGLMGLLNDLFTKIFNWPGADDFVTFENEFRSNVKKADLLYPILDPLDLK